GVRDSFADLDGRCAPEGLRTARGVRGSFADLDRRCAPEGLCPSPPRCGHNGRHGFTREGLRPRLRPSSYLPRPIRPPLASQPPTPAKRTLKGSPLPKA